MLNTQRKDSQPGRPTGRGPAYTPSGNEGERYGSNEPVSAVMSSLCRGKTPQYSSTRAFDFGFEFLATSDNVFKLVNEPIDLVERRVTVRTNPHSTGAAAHDDLRRFKTTANHVGVVTRQIERDNTRAMVPGSRCMQRRAEFL